MTEVDKQSRRAAGRSPVLDKDVESKGQENYPCSQGPRPSTGERWGGKCSGKQNNNANNYKGGPSKRCCEVVLTHISPVQALEEKPQGKSGNGFLSGWESAWNQGQADAQVNIRTFATDKCVWRGLLLNSHRKLM